MEKYGIEYNADVGRIDLTPYWYAWEWLKENLADKIKYTTSDTSAQEKAVLTKRLLMLNSLSLILLLKIF